LVLQRDQVKAHDDGADGDPRHAQIGAVVALERAEMKPEPLRLLGWF
jgi:hypothetical protein